MKNTFRFSIKGFHLVVSKSDAEGENGLKDLNLVPKSYFQKKKKKKKIVFYSIFSMVIVATVVVVALIPILKIRDLKSRVTSMALRAKEISGYLETEAEFSTLKSLYLQRENEATRLLGDDLDVLRTIEKLESYLADKIFIQSLSISKGKGGQAEISIRGIASSEEEIATFYDYVHKDEFFGDIFISTVSSMQTEGQKDSGQNKVSNSSYAFDAVIHLTSGK